jgi:hypothetical protein
MGTKARLIDRWCNSMERLADCNLFADQRTRDLREASDDLRRAIRMCYILPENQRKIAEARLMYKQAMVLSLRSPAQDIPLAVSYCQQAEMLRTSLVGSQMALLDFQSKLAPAIVGVYRVCAEKPDSAESKRAALAKLRGAIEELREQWKNNDKRDYLEFLMFASKVLLDEGIDADRYETLMDCEMLLGFCRRALLSNTRETLSYLRPYFDTAMEVRLRLKPKDAKELLEVQWEATQGKPFLKMADSAPVLALYVLADKPYLILDVPHGASTYYCLSGECSCAEILKAATPQGTQIELPREVLRDLQKISAFPQESRLLHCWWEDPVRKLNAGQFPFKLPSGVKTAPDVRQ